MYKIGLIIVGYNRLISIKRLLKSLENAVFSEEEDEVDLIFDIDHSGSDKIIEFAKAYHWAHGETKLRTYDERLGLRTHMMELGYWFDYYDALVVLEDDIYVSPYFFDYVKANVDKYYYDNDICGIALYSIERNEHEITLYPISSDYDNFFMKKPCSWGQIWLKNQWLEFKKWYQRNNSNDLNIYDIPECFRNYPETSYLKYFITYMVDKDKYFSYPYVSYSTCFADEGEHAKVSTFFFHANLMLKKKESYRLSDFKDGVKYDAYDELIDLESFLSSKYDIPTTVDFYCEKKKRNRFLLTFYALDYKIIRSYGMSLKPIEANVFLDNPGNDLFLYDTTITVKNKNKFHKGKLLLYNFGPLISDKKNIAIILCEYIKTWIYYHIKK